jgi:hypothetical protein
MNYSDHSANEQRHQIAAFGYQQTVAPDCYDVRAAMKAKDIAQDACRSSDPAKSALRFAVFIKAAKMARLKPRHILAWVARNWGGKQAIADFAASELGMQRANALRDRDFLTT